MLSFGSFNSTEYIQIDTCLVKNIKIVSTAFIICQQRSKLMKLIAKTFVEEANWSISLLSLKVTYVHSVYLHQKIFRCLKMTKNKIFMIVFKMQKDSIFLFINFARAGDLNFNFRKFLWDIFLILWWNVLHGL